MEHYSILMSVYYKEKPEYLSESIQSMLHQTVPPDDFVLVCDGPLTPGLDQVIDHFVQQEKGLFQVIRLEKNQGLGNALNAGMKYCKNDLVARMDSDDISLPERCELQLKKFEESPELDIVSGTVLEFLERTDNILVRKELPETNEEIYKFALTRAPFNHPVAMYRKEAVERAGGYRGDYPLFEDYYLWVRMLQNHVIGYNLKEPVYLFRADANMYGRRGGFGYLKKMCKFRTYMYKSHFCSFRHYLMAIVGQSIVCLVPTGLRRILYNKLLRN